MFISGHFHVLCMPKPHYQRNANREVATTSPRFCNEPHLLHVLFVKVCAWHHLHILVKPLLLWLKRPSSKFAKLHTVAASNKDPMLCSSYFCLFTSHGCCSSCTSRSWWIAHSPQR